MTVSQLLQSKAGAAALLGTYEILVLVITLGSDDETMMMMIKTTRRVSEVIAPNVLWWQ